jgi:hypothetical protein
MSEQRMLIKKLAEIMKEVKYIQKTGKNKFHGYTYCKESDVSEKIREELAKRSVMMVPSVISHEHREHINARGKTEYIARVLMSFTFMDGDTGEEISFQISGEGQDSGDKAVYKAMTGAEKYALMKCFLIPTGDDPTPQDDPDPENDRPQEPQEQPKKQQQPPKQQPPRKQQQQTTPPAEGVDKKNQLHQVEGELQAFCEVCEKPVTAEHARLCMNSNNGRIFCNVGCKNKALAGIVN